MSLLWFIPCADSEDLVEVQSHLTFLNQTFHVSLHISGQDPHEGLGGEPVLGPLLVVALGHVGEHGVGGLVDVVDDLAEVTPEHRPPLMSLYIMIKQ